jgi:hypothetical protein
VIFLVPVAVLLLWVWGREGRAVLGWPVIVAPLLMVHYPMQHRIFDLRLSAWELGSRAGSEKVFSLDYLFHGVPPDDHGNLQAAMNFFFARPSDQPNSLVLSVLGCLAVPFFAWLVVKRLRTLAQESPVNVAVTLFAFGFAAHMVLMMLYFFGQFDNVVIRRLSLPPHLGMVIAIMAVLPQMAHAAVARVLLFIAVTGLFASGVPSMAAHAYSQEYLPGKETAWRREFMAQQTRRDYVVIDNDSILWIAHQISSTPVLQAKGDRRDALIFLMRNHAYSDVYVFQRYNIDADTGRMTLRDGDDLGPDFVLETVREERLQTLTLSRISRVKEIRKGGVSATAPDPVTHLVPKSRAEIEKNRRVYLENFVKMLP